MAFAGSLLSGKPAGPPFSLTLLHSFPDYTTLNTFFGRKGMLVVVLWTSTCILLFLKKLIWFISYQTSLTLGRYRLTMVVSDRQPDWRRKDLLQTYYLAIWSVQDQLQFISFRKCVCKRVKANYAVLTMYCRFRCYELTIFMWIMVHVYRNWAWFSYFC